MRWQIHPRFKNAFGYKDKDGTWLVVGHVERWGEWEDRLEGIVKDHNYGRRKQRQNDNAGSVASYL